MGTVILIVILYLIGLVIGFLPQLKAWFYQRPPAGPAQTHGAQGALHVSYFNALFPQTGQDYLNALTDTKLQQLWDSLGWYYLPLVQQIDDSKRAPLANNSPSTWTQYFPADGADEGNYGSPVAGSVAGTFFCSVFSAQLGAPISEYTCYGQPYQAIQFIQMTGRRNGFPNNAYIEPVAFVCEGLGKSLLTAPACEENAPAQKCQDGSSPIPKCGQTSTRPSTALVLRGGASALPSAYAGSAAGGAPGQGFNFMPNQSRGDYGAAVSRPAGGNFIDQNPAYASNRAEAAGRRRKKPAKTRKTATGSPVDCTTVSPTCPPTSPCNKCGKSDGSCCSYTNEFGMPDTCCWNYKTDAVNPDCCEWPAICSAYKSPSSGNIYNNYCAAPCTWQCDPSTGACDWFIIDATNPADSTEWLDWLKTQSSGSTAWVDTLLYQCQPCAESGGKCKAVNNTNQLPDNWMEADFESTMFYWLPGYGKFMNFGTTGAYFQYIHFLMTCPKYSADGKQYLRWSFPQIVQTSVLNQGNSELKTQLEDLTSGELTDERQYLEGYVTTLTGDDTPAGGTEVSNTMKWSGNIGNVGGLVNPKDDPFLQWLDETITIKYYAAADKVANPQWKKTIEYHPDEAVALVAGSAIYGATGAQALGYFKDNYPDKYQTGYGYWPFGSFFSGSNLGGCAYNTVYRLAWDSVQLTMMPTGTGSAKYCNYPAYDFELVFMGSKQWICQNGMKMLDPTQDWNNYTQYGFVQGSGDLDVDTAALNVAPLDASKMALSERNVPCCWGDQPMPNATKYTQPDPLIKDTSNCPYKDDVSRYIYDKGGNNGVPPSCT